MSRVSKASFNYCASTLTLISGLSSGVLLARLLSPTEMGVYSYALWLWTTLATMANLGYPIGLSRYTAELVAEGRLGDLRMTLMKAIRSQVFRGAVVAVSFLMLFMVVPPLVLDRMKEARGFWAILIGTGVLSASLAALGGAVYDGFQRFDIKAFVAAFIVPVYLGGLAFVLFKGYGAIGGVAAGVGADLLRVIFAGLFVWITLSARRPSTDITASQVWPRLVRFSRTLSIAILLDIIVWQRSEVFLLNIFSRPSEIAFYSLAFGLAYSIFRVSATPLAGLFLPSFTTTWRTKPSHLFRAEYPDAVRKMAFIAAPLALGGVTIADDLVIFLYGPQYLPAATCLRVLLLAAGCTSVGTVFAAFFHATENAKIVVKIGVVAAVIDIAVALLLIPNLGAIGAASASAAAQIFAVVAGGMYVTYRYAANFPGGSVLRICLAAGLMAVMTHGIMVMWGGPVGMILAVAGGGLLYLSFLIFFQEVEVRRLKAFLGVSSIRTR
jgi:O-antigen/teichoic acid export membrane protein